MTRSLQTLFGIPKLLVVFAVNTLIERRHNVITITCFAAEHVPYSLPRLKERRITSAVVLDAALNIRLIIANRHVSVGSVASLLHITESTDVFLKVKETTTPQYIQKPCFQGRPICRY